MPDFTPSTPEKEQVALSLPDAPGGGYIIKEFTDYSFNSNFLTPVDGWTFTVGADKLSPDLQQALKTGVRVQLSVGGVVQSSGFVDSIEIEGTRSGGSQWHIGGRDCLAQAFDACADPTQQIKEGSTLLEALKTLFKPFGWGTDDSFVNNNEANRAASSNAYRGKTNKSDGKGFGRRGIKEYQLHQLRPYPKEGVLTFAQRITQRQGLWLWPSADGKQLIVGEPNFDQDPTFKFVRSKGGNAGQTNVLTGAVRYDQTDQFTHIVADGFSAGGEFGKSRLRIVMANPAFGDISVPEVDKYVKAGARVIGGTPFPASSQMIAARPRIMYLHDDESDTLEKLESFVRREMSMAQRKSITCNFTCEGHGQANTASGLSIFNVDTIVSVADELSGLQENLWIVGRTFTKSRGSGTTSKIELIRKNTLEFSDTGK